ncbi:MAG TPA: DMT family transporter [Rhodobacteraceae bacterium]|nr:DMT family transporter [Paracoccaceae bacterium]
MTRARANLRGIALMIAAMAGFTLTDSFVKSAARDLPVGQILAVAGILGGSAFALMTRAQGHAVITRDFLLWPVILRNLSEIAGTICYVTALSKIDLSVASAIIQATPLAVTLGAVVMLGETVHWRRWGAIFVGFAGVLIILRPGGSAFDPDMLWAVAGLFALAMRDLATRLVPKNMPTLRVSTYGMTMLLPAGLLLILLGQTPQPMDMQNWGQVFGFVVLGVLGYWAITAAMRVGDVSVVAPFRYSRIIFALIIGTVVFGEHPDFWTLFGATLTILAGIYAFMRERRLASALPSRPKAQ